MELLIQPVFANAFLYAIDKATPEGKVTIGALAVVSLFSWTVIITKIRQLYRAWKMSKKFFEAYRSTRDPLDLFRKKEEFDGAPAFEVYFTGGEELAYHLKNNTVEVKNRSKLANVTNDGIQGVHTAL